MTNATTREYFTLKVFKGSEFAGYFIRDGKAWKLAKVSPTSLRSKVELTEKELKSAKTAFLKLTKDVPKKYNIQASRVTEKVDEQIIWSK
jgi:hypothetical protein